jgi:hypothetical protein
LTEVLEEAALGAKTADFPRGLPRRGESSLAFVSARHKIEASGEFFPEKEKIE